MPATPPTIIHFAVVGAPIATPYRVPPTDTTMLYIPTGKVGFDRTRAFAEYPEVKVTIGGKEYRKGVWRMQDYTKAEKKLIGFMWDGVLISCTESDQNGLAVIADKIRKYGLTIDVVLANENVVRVTPATVDDLEMKFMQHRQTFFSGLVPMNASLKTPPPEGE